MQTRLHFNFKDLFRALRLGFSAKKIWMLCLGLLFGLTGYSSITYLAHWAAGNELLTVWDSYRLLPFPEPGFLAFPWYSWVIYAVAVTVLLLALMITGVAITKVAYEQLRGDEFYEARQAFRFALRHASSILLSPLLILGFIVALAIGGLLLGFIGRIPQAGPLFVGLLSFPSFIAGLFVVYLLVVLLATLLLGPAVVGTTRNDIFDTLFEVFSCVNEQPWRLVWYTTLVAGLAKVGSLLLGLAASLAGRIGCYIIGLSMGSRTTEMVSNAAFYFKVTLPDWWPLPLHRLFTLEAAAYGLPQIYRPTNFYPTGFGADVGAALIALCFYVVAFIVIAYGLSVWFTGNALSYIVMVHKKDEKNIIEIPDDEEELIEPVVTPQEVPPPPAAAS